MASHLINSAPESSQCSEWARLIPGKLPTVRKTSKKPPQSVRLFEVSAGAVPLERAGDSEAMALLLPNPLRGGRAKEWLKSVIIDFVLIAFDWLFLGGLTILLPPLARAIGLRQGVWSPVLLMGISILHAALITLVAHTEGLYAAHIELTSQARILAKAILLSTSVLCIAYPLHGAPWNIAIWLWVAGWLHFGTLWLCRWRAQSRQQRKVAGFAGRNVLVVGAGAVGKRIASYIESHPSCGRRMCGFLDDEKTLDNGVVGRISDLAVMARRGFVDELILAAPREREVTMRVLREAKRLHLDVEIIPELFGCDPSTSEIERFANLPVIQVHAERLPAGSLAFKRLIDIVGAGFGLIALSPLLLLIAALIKIDSSGPALYVAPRAGRKGRLFRCFKFRTMITNADRVKDSLRHRNERSGPLFKIAQDPRITTVGHWLRRYSLDELPQLWNVFRGEMSLVGPRPHPLDDFAGYELSHLGRLDVTPGLTGLWQVSARRDPSFDRAMDLDREYILNWSLGLDLQILFRTVMAVAQGSGN